MMRPTIHMNGTSPRTLLDDYTDAIFALIQAIEKVGNAGPNGRDYYPQGPDAFETARKEHEARLARLQDVRKELDGIAEFIADAC